MSTSTTNSLHNPSDDESSSSRNERRWPSGPPPANPADKIREIFPGLSQQGAEKLYQLQLTELEDIAALMAFDNKALTTNGISLVDQAKIAKVTSTRLAKRDYTKSMPTKLNSWTPQKADMAKPSAKEHVMNLIVQLKAHNTDPKLWNSALLTTLKGPALAHMTRVYEENPMQSFEEFQMAFVKANTGPADTTRYTGLMTSVKQDGRPVRTYCEEFIRYANLAEIADDSVIAKKLHDMASR